ncbi:hypothetical protein BCV69DRAFT_216343 [Microstroma glucosiphilum]|uniref:Secreted protein n=1 Tax=Pseudomicrostroma glucosiphilum TaxID=1684307 RepID=A0A316U406_9BASI|nr:hypothetical protein BCV69DRAFT_216343 [Pseudomicrostroma glucosiphilum]PWN20016.1 hypothetical protein BCV69DRAFT_216343 [Pseudomicrostroma glucosiphilum]
MDGIGAILLVCWAELGLGGLNCTAFSYTKSFPVSSSPEIPPSHSLMLSLFRHSCCPCERLIPSDCKMMPAANTFHFLHLPPLVSLCTSRRDAGRCVPC